MKFKNIEIGYKIVPSLVSDTNIFKTMKFVKAYDSYDLDENGDPKDLSYQAGSETSGVFPKLKISPEYVPVGDIDSYCVHLAWRYKDEKH